MEIQVVVLRSAAEEIGAVMIGLGALGVQEDWLDGQAPPVRRPWDQGPAAPLPDSVVLRAWWPEGSAPAAGLKAQLGDRPGVVIESLKGLTQVGRHQDGDRVSLTYRSARMR